MKNVTIALDEKLLELTEAEAAKAGVSTSEFIADIVEAALTARTTGTREKNRQLEALDVLHPQYGFAKHKGYPTAAHVAALMTHGAIDDHRRSFKPVRDALARN